MGVALIMRGITDWFGAAKIELLALLNLADECANNLLSQNQEHHLIIESKICLSQKCNHCGRFIYKRRLACLMHNLDRILKPLLLTLFNLRMSQERQANKLTDAANCRASVHLMTLVRDYFGGESSESWKAVKTLAACFDSDTEISHLILTARVWSQDRVWSHLLCVVLIFGWQCA